MNVNIFHPEIEFQDIIADRLAKSLQVVTNIFDRKIPNHRYKQKR